MSGATCMATVEGVKVGASPLRRAWCAGMGAAVARGAGPARRVCVSED